MKSSIGWFFRLCPFLILGQAVAVNQPRYSFVGSEYQKGEFAAQWYLPEGEKARSLCWDRKGTSDEIGDYIIENTCVVFNDYNQTTYNNGRYEYMYPRKSVRVITEAKGESHDLVLQPSKVHVGKKKFCDPDVSSDTTVKEVEVTTKDNIDSRPQTIDVAVHWENIGGVKEDVEICITTSTCCAAFSPSKTTCFISSAFPSVFVRNIALRKDSKYVEASVRRLNNCEDAVPAWPWIDLGFPYLPFPYLFLHYELYPNISCLVRGINDEAPLLFGSCDDPKVVLARKDSKSYSTEDGLCVAASEQGIGGFVFLRPCADISPQYWDLGFVAHKDILIPKVYLENFKYGAPKSSLDFIGQTNGAVAIFEPYTDPLEEEVSVDTAETDETIG